MCGINGSQCYAQLAQWKVYVCNLQEFVVMSTLWWQDVKRMRLHHAKQYAKFNTPARALLKMQEDNVPVAHRPTGVQLKNLRPVQVSQATKQISVATMGDLKNFLSDPPSCIKIHSDAVVLQEDRICIPFSIPALESTLADSKLACFVCDFTCKVCSEGLLLGCIGPVGLRPSDHGPSMRMIPAFFAVCSHEDDASHEVLLSLFFDSLTQRGVKVTDGFFDCSCMQAVMNFVRDKGLDLFVHRCLQHVKSNIRDESGKRDVATGRTRLQNKELLGPIIDWVEFSAFLPSDIEFHSFWTSVLTRMSSNQEETDFGELEMSLYLRKHILDSSGVWRYFRRFSFQHSLKQWIFSMVVGIPDCHAIIHDSISICPQKKSWYFPKPLNN